MTHVIEVEIRRFYRVYVEDEADAMTENEAMAAARKEVLENQEAALTVEPDLGIEEHDILAASYEYSF